MIFWLHSRYNIFYYKNNKKSQILSGIHRVIHILNYNQHNNLFEQNRISGNLIVRNGNVTLTINLSNVQYNESGVFSLEFASLVGVWDNAKNNITVDVQSKFLSLVR